MHYIFYHLISSISLLGRASPVPGQRCTSTEVYNAILYEHAIVAQAVAAAAPQG